MKAWILGKPARAYGYSAVELLGVLAVIAVLGVVATQYVITRIRDERRVAERTSLANMAEALKVQLPRGRSVPAAGGLPDAIALELAISPSEVRKNPSGFERSFLFDPAFRLGTNVAGVPPYTQTAAGSIQPVSPRALIVSSLSGALPAEVDFDELWDLPSGAVPSGWTVAADDLFVQRVNLEAIFLHVLLDNVDPARAGPFAVDGSALQYVPVDGRQDAWFLTGSVLTLYYASGQLQARVILHEDTSYVFENGQWQRHIIYGRRPPLNSFGELVDAFLNAPPPPDPKFGATQQLVIQEFFTYMYAYTFWSATTPPFDKGGSSSAQQVPWFRMLKDVNARIAAVTYNLIN